MKLLREQNATTVKSNTLFTFTWYIINYLQYFVKILIEINIK